MDTTNVCRVAVSRVASARRTPQYACTRSRPARRDNSWPTSPHVPGSGVGIGDCIWVFNSLCGGCPADEMAASAVMQLHTLQLVNAGMRDVKGDTRNRAHGPVLDPYRQCVHAIVRSLSPLDICVS